MNSIQFKDVVLYFIAANAFFFLLLNADNEFAVIPFGIGLLVLFFIYLLRVKSEFHTD